ncbi:unnamed protein product [Meloidogyne enterolobii]|uniref:Uncharacterized protein n=1 Tax=Meloidogyne enterolobii TaxID=390850 RepID=A0ACB0ZS20_MELEN
MRKTQEGKKQQSTKTNNNSPFSYNNTCGRITPFPSLLIDQQLPATTSSTSQLLLDSESESLDNNTKNCGRFPTIPSEKHQFHPLQVNINEEADKSSSSSLLQKQSSPTFSLSSSIAELPQPAPKHHLREQLLKIKQKNVFAGNSFFGGISNNPFFFGNQKQQKQRKILPTAKQLLHSSSPNFPQTNTVISRVNELEERQQKNKKNNTVAKPFGIAVQQQQNINSSQLLQANSTQNSSSKIKSANNSVTRNDRLSPRSSLFRTKPVIVVDLGQEEEINEVKRKEEENLKQNNKKEEEKLKQKLIKYFEEEVEDIEEQKLKSNNFEKHQNISKTSSEIKEKSKSVTALVKQNVMPKHFQFNILKSTPSTSSPRNSKENTENVDNKQSPRWRADSLNEALPAFKKDQQLQKQQSLPSVIDQKQRLSTSLENTPSSPVNETLLPVGKTEVDSNKYIFNYDSFFKQNSTLPIIEPTTPTNPNTFSSLPLIQTEKRKIEDNNKYLNGFALNNNNNEEISSTFLPQTVIQTSALQAQQQIKNNSTTTTSLLPTNQKNIIITQNGIIPNNSELHQQQQKTNNNSEFEKQFSSSLSPPPCYQQAANSLRLSPIAGRLAGIPRFHFPMGRPIGKAESDAKLSRIKELFQSFPDGKISFADFDELLYDACCRMNNLTSIPPSSVVQTENEQNLKDSHKIDFNQFIIYWNRMCAEAHDEATKFIFTLNAATRPFNSHCLRKEDFLPILMDLILTHPGLHFLKEAPQFYSKYCEVVIVRIFWNVNRSWSGRITASELRRSNFLQTFRMLDDITDINRITDYFSYEHFYVTYCKFWELDTDHDMVISRDDMKRHCNGALTDRIIDRIFSAAVLRTPSEQKTISEQGPVKQQPIETIGFEDFVCFLLAEEDKRHPTSVEYWFRCIDLDGDGQISLYEMEYFYEAIEQKLNSKNMETLALRDVICNVL